MKKKNVIVIIAFLLIASIGFGAGFFVGSKSKKSAESTTSVSTTNTVESTQPITQAPIVPADVTLTYNQDGTRVILTDFYKMQIPDSWGETFSYKKMVYKTDGSYGLYFRHDKSYAENSGGHLFTIELHSVSLNYAAELEQYSPTPFDYIGTISVPGQDDYQVIVTYSSDCQFSEAYESEHDIIMDTLKDALNTIEGVNGATYEKLI